MSEGNWDRSPGDVNEFFFRGIEEVLNFYDFLEVSEWCCRGVVDLTTGLFVFFLKLWVLGTQKITQLPGGLDSQNFEYYVNNPQKFHTLNSKKIAKSNFNFNNVVLQCSEIFLVSISPVMPFQIFFWHKFTILFFVINVIIFYAPPCLLFKFLSTAILSILKENKTTNRKTGMKGEVGV